MNKKYTRVRIDIMNRNTITSLAMLYALWQSKRQDLLDLIKPFVLFSVSNTTSKGDRIDIDSVCRYLECEFGYKFFQPTVVKKILNRECQASIKMADRKITRKSNEFFLVSPYSELIDRFSEKRTNCKAHSDAVTSALAQYLNVNNVYKKNTYSQQDAEVILLSFFERRGSTILLSVDDFSQLLAKADESEYFVGKFILEQNEKKSVLMDYIIELVKGYFVTTALYLQADNTDVTRASFSDVTFFLDTRILLGYLGYKTPQENDSIQYMVKSLKKSGAKLSCFSYNEDEIESILRAYRQSTMCGTSNSPYTLEYFDSLGQTSTLVEAAEKFFRSKLKSDNIVSISPNHILEQAGLSDSTDGILDDSRVHEIVDKIKPTYKFEGFSDDMSAINTVSRLRGGKRLPYIEKCRAVFVTSNTTLVTAIKQYLRENSIDYGFPIVISADDLCVLAWLKDFEIDNNLPQMRLLENVMAAVTPSKDLMDEYFKNLDNLKMHGKIDDNEISLLRIDHYAQKQLMELTGGNSNNVTEAVIEKIREKIRGDSFISGVEQGKNSAAAEYFSMQQAQRNNVCKRAEDEVEYEYKEKERKHIRTIKIVSAFIALAFIAASLFSIWVQWDSSITIPLIFVTIITTVQGVIPFFNKDNCLIRLEKKRLLKKKLKDTDLRKEKYLSILDASKENA